MEVVAARDEEVTDRQAFGTSGPLPRAFRSSGFCIGMSGDTTGFGLVNKYSVVKHPAVRDARACDLLLFLRGGLLRLRLIGRFSDGLVEEFLLLYGG